MNNELKKHNTPTLVIWHSL